MHSIPTRIQGVTVIREAKRRRRDGSNVVTRHSVNEAIHAFELTTEAEVGFTSELSYTRRPVTRMLRCIDGEVFVAVADLRLGSPTFGHWQGFYLGEDESRSLKVPAGVACGWQVTSEVGRLEQKTNTEMLSEDWRWLPWNDIELGVAWPEVPEQFAEHSRRSRSLASLPDRALPKFRSGKRKLANPNAPKQTSKTASEARLSSAAAKPTLAEPHKSRVAAYRDELILVIGSSGQLGKDLCRHLSKRGTVVGACREPERGSLLPVPVHVDVSRPASIRQAIRRVKPTLIVNASGLTDLQKSESEPRLAQLINATAPAIMADEAKHIGASLVHYCTDMVFDGNGERPWRETDTPSPINQYGRTKLLGTEAIRKSGVPHLIVRAGWLYASQGDNFVTKLVDLLTYRNSIQLASDFYGTPTSTDWLAEMTASILSKSKGNLANWLLQHGGLFHIAPLGYASRLDVGDQVVAACRAHALPIVSNKLQSSTLKALTSVDVPANCRLDCSKLALRFGVSLPRWQQELVSEVSDMLGVSKLSDRIVA